MLIFCFGWRDGPPEDLATVWYKKWGALLSLARRGLEVHPETLRPALRPLCTGDHAAACCALSFFQGDGGEVRLFQRLGLFSRKSSEV